MSSSDPVLPIPLEQYTRLVTAVHVAETDHLKKMHQLEVQHMQDMASLKQELAIANGEITRLGSIIAVMESAPTKPITKKRSLASSLEEPYVFLSTAASIPFTDAQVACDVPWFLTTFSTFVNDCDVAFKRGFDWSLGRKEAVLGFLRENPQKWISEMETHASQNTVPIKEWQEVVASICMKLYNSCGNVKRANATQLEEERSNNEPLQSSVHLSNHFLYVY